MLAPLGVILCAHARRDLLDLLAGFQKFLDIFVKFPTQISRGGITLFLFTQNRLLTMLTQSNSTKGRGIVQAFRVRVSAKPCGSTAGRDSSPILRCARVSATTANCLAASSNSPLRGGTFSARKHWHAADFGTLNHRLIVASCQPPARWRKRSRVTDLRVQRTIGTIPNPRKKNALLSHFDECEAARDQRFASIISARLFSGSCRILRR